MSDEIRKLIGSEKLLLGTEQTIKALKGGKLAKVFLASNTSDKVKADITHYSEIAKVEVVETDKTNEELGTVCKKPFSISVIGILK